MYGIGQFPIIEFSNATRSLEDTTRSRPWNEAKTTRPAHGSVVATRNHDISNFFTKLQFLTSAVFNPKASALSYILSFPFLSFPSALYFSVKECWYAPRSFLFRSSPSPTMASEQPQHQCDCGPRLQSARAAGHGKVVFPPGGQANRLQ